VGQDRAEEAAPAGSSPGYRALVWLTAMGCVLAAYVFMGAPGVQGSSLAAYVPVIDPMQGWLPAAHFLFSAAMLTGGFWFARVLRDIPRPGAIPLVLFALFQFGLLATVLANFAIAIAAFRGAGDVATGFGFLIVAIIALRVHPDLYMSVLRYTRWVRTPHGSEHSPAMGSLLVALTAASNLVPLALTFQALTTHSGAMLATLFRRAVIDPQMYLAGIANQMATVSAAELSLAAMAAAVSVALGLFWGVSRLGTVNRLARAERVAQSLSAAQLRFADDALPAVADAINARASSSRFVLWSSVWMFLVTPVLLAAAYAAAMWFDVLQEQHILSWITASASDFRPFATGEAKYAQYLIPAALVWIAATMSAPVARSLFSGARYDQFAFGQPMHDIVRAQLYHGLSAGTIGPGQPFDAEAFASRATRRGYWARSLLAMAAIGVAATSGLSDIARGIAFTGEGLIIQEHYFAPAKLVRFNEVQAVAIDCRMDARGTRPVYELSLPDGRVANMVGASAGTARSISGRRCAVAVQRRGVCLSAGRSHALPRRDRG
jgi:hypothetical protein